MQVDIVTAPDADSTSHDGENEMEGNQRKATIEDELEKARTFLEKEELDFLTRLASSTTSIERAELMAEFVEAKKRGTGKSDCSTSSETEETGATAGNNPGTGTNANGSSGAMQKFLDFVPIVLDNAIGQWGNGNVRLVLNYVEVSPEETTDRDGLIKWAEMTSKEKQSINLLVVFNKTNQRNYVSFEPNEFMKIEADAKFGKAVGDLGKLQEFCTNTLLPLQGFSEGVVPPDLDYVEFENYHNAFESDDNIQLDKSYAVVVAGESGSGKSVLSCLLSKKYGYLPLYVLLALRKPDPEDSDDKKKKVTVDVSDIMQKKPKSEFPELHECLRSQLTCKDHPIDNDAVQALCAIKSKLNVTMNSWAKEVLDKAMANALNHDDNARLWFDGRWRDERRPEKVAIILDEATDIDLVKGLIETARTIYSEYARKKLVTKHLLLVLTGTGLDAIRYPGRLIKVIGPKGLDVLKDTVGDEIVEAAERGLFSRVMKTNTRMLFRSVIPILKMGIFHDDAKFDEQDRKRQRLRKRLREVASAPVFMDHGPRFYVNQSSIGQLGPERREHLLKDAFLYHLITAIKNGLKNGVSPSVEPIGTKALSYFERIRDSNLSLEQSRRQSEKRTSTLIEVVGKDEIFECGLATRDHTSSALKYLASFGLTCRLRAGWGDEFEELTALHFMRLMEAQGFETDRIELQYSWPPQSQKADKDIGTEEIRKLMEKLEVQMATELSDFEVSSLDKHCTIFSQGTPSAQGSDVLLLSKNGEEYVLESIQCKNAFPRNVISWWWSLGIKCKKATGSADEWDFSPKTGSAGYSYAGLEAFRSLLEQKVQKIVKLGPRTMAVSRPMPRGQASFPCPESGDARVWFREMFEPTISVFPPSEH